MPASSQFDLSNNWSALPAMTSCHIAGLLFLPLMPLLMGVIASDFAAVSITLGAIASLQLGSTAVGAFLFSKLGTRYNCRVLILIAILVELLVNTACAFTGSITTIALLRILAGLAEGMLLAGASATAAMSGKTERVFVYYNVALAVFAVPGLLLGSIIIQQFGHTGGFLLFSVVDLLALVLIFRGFPGFLLQTNADHTDSNSPYFIQRKSRALLALILFGVALAGTQTFIERLAIWHGGSLSTIGAWLAAGWCLAIVSPFMLIPLLRKWGGVKPLIIAYLLVTAAAAVLSLTTSLSFYLIAAALFTPLVMFIEPLQFGILGAMDRTGRLAALGPAAISIGSGIGPIISSLFVSAFGLKSIGILASFLLLTSILVLYPLAMKVYRSDTSIK